MIDEGGVQCGFCTPGIVVAGVRLLEENPSPGEDEIRDGKVAVKFLRSGEQQLTLGRDAAGDWIRDYIDSI